jgi:hypothetical protein
MIATDEVRPVTSSLADLREVTLPEMASLSAEVVGPALDRILRQVPAAPQPQGLPLFNSSI